MSEEKIEFTTRGLKQFRSIIYEEIKHLVDEQIKTVLDKIIQNRVEAKLQGMSHTIDDIIKTQIKGMYWHVMEEALKDAEFQELFKTEIVKYLHTRWACGSVPFDLQFDMALKKAVKDLIGGGK